ncbi:hypothetical protein ACP70R_003058 [Stipagrostis hirtigluma subsp. patula]
MSTQSPRVSVDIGPPAGAEGPRPGSGSRWTSKVNEMRHQIVFCVALLEWGGNAIGTLAMLWATVVLLGGFCSMLNPMDFWFATVMIFIEATRVFIGNDASVNQWLFGSTRALRFMDLSFTEMIVRPSQEDNLLNLFAVVVVALCICIVPVLFRPEIGVSICKVALLVIISQLLIRPHKKIGQDGLQVIAVIFLPLSVVALLVGLILLSIRQAKEPRKSITISRFLSALKTTGLVMAWLIGTVILSVLFLMLRSRSQRNPIVLFCAKSITAAWLACLPLFLSIIPAHCYRYFSLTTAALVLSFGTLEYYKTREENSNSMQTREENIRSWGPAMFPVVDIILQILFFWSLMFPLPGISLKLAFYILLPVLAVVIVGNLQIPVAIVQVVLSILRLRRLLGRHHDYDPLPEGSSPNMVPSIVGFFLLELCQGSSYILASILGLVYFSCRGFLVREAGLVTEDWGAKAVDRYYRHAYQTHKQKGLFPSEKYKPSLETYAVESLISSSDEMKLDGLRIIHSFLQRTDPDPKKECIKEIISCYTSKNAVSSLIDMLGYTVEEPKHIRRQAAEVGDTVVEPKHFSRWAAKVIAKLSGSLKIAEFPGMVKLVASLLDTDNQQESLPNPASEHNGGNDRHRRPSTQTAESRSSTPARPPDEDSFPILGLRILEGLACDPQNCTEIVKEATNIISKVMELISYHIDKKNTGQQEEVISLSLTLLRTLATTDGKIGAAFRQELWENPLLLDSLECILKDGQPELREPVMVIIAKLALDEVARQETRSTQALIDILMHVFLWQGEDPSKNYDHSLRMAAGEALVNLTMMSRDNCWLIMVGPGYNLIKNLPGMLDNECMYVAAYLLHNLCAHYSAEELFDLGANVHLESAMPKVMKHITTKEGKQLEAALSLASQIGRVIRYSFAQELEKDTNEELVKKLVDALKMEPSDEYPRMRRVLIEMVISIVESCPQYKNTFIQHGGMDALDSVKRTPSRLEKYRTCLGGERVVAESLPMRHLVNNAKSLILTPTPSGQPNIHA